MELTHEKFEGARELMEISTQISQGRAALEQLKKDEGAYLEERELKLVARLSDALVNSSDLIAQIGGNHDALVGYRNEVKGFLEDILSLLQSVTKLKERVNATANDLDGRITKHEEDVKRFALESSRERSVIENERAELSLWRDRLGEDKRELDDRIETFERTLTR